MDPVLCSELIIELFTVFVCSIALKNDNITVISRYVRTIFASEWSFSLFFTVFDPSRPLEGRYGHCFVLGRDNQVVYGVCVLCSA